MHRIEKDWGHLKLLQLKQLPKMTSYLGLRLEAFRLRSRAKELVHRAETMHDADARLKIREVAAGYERLAQCLEDGARDKAH